MGRIRQLASLGHAARKRANVNVRRPLPAIRVAGPPGLRDLPEPLLDVLAAELNVRRVDFPAPETLQEAVRRRVETNPKLLGPKYGRDYPRLRAALNAGAFEAAEGGRVRVRLDEGRELELEPEEASVTLEPAPGFAAAVEDGVLVVLDTSQTPELVAEGRARELVRLIQEARKAADFDVADRIVVGVDLPPELRQVLESQAAYVRRETLATSLVDLPDGADNSGPVATSGSPWGPWTHRAEDEIDGLPVVVAVRRSGA
jgi:isoleucyl-tRNA synthetase